MDHLLFQEEVKKLVNLLLKIDDKNLSNELISMLFDMVVGGTFSHQIRHDITDRNVRKTQFQFQESSELFLSNP